MTANRKKAPEYLKDDHLSVGTKEYLKVLNSGDKPVESLSVPEARKVLVTAQASVKTDLSGIEESEKTITVDDHMLRLNILRPQGIHLHPRWRLGIRRLPHPQTSGP